MAPRNQGSVPEWPKGADCKSAGTAFDGSNPSRPTSRRSSSVSAEEFLHFDDVEPPPELAADLPLDARQLGRVARRAIFAMARVGSDYAPGSGDYAIAFSTAADVRIRPVNQSERYTPRNLKTLPNDGTSPLFLAVIEATEEAIYNSLFRATTITGKGRTVQALPLDRTVEILRKHGLIVPSR